MYIFAFILTARRLCITIILLFALLEADMIIKEDFFEMRDGVRLYTRCVLPYENGKFPIVFIRTPYEPPLNGTPCDAKKYDNDLFLRTAIFMCRTPIQESIGQGQRV